MNQLPFTSINYGTSTCIEGREIIKAILKGSIKGIGKYHRTPIFPCGIFQLKKGINVKKGDPNYDLKKLAIKSTIKRLYPNYANCDWTVQQSWHEEDIELKENVVNKLDKDFKQELIKFLKKNPQFKEKLSLKIENDELVVDKNEAPTSIFGTMGCRTANGSDVNFTEEYYLNQLKNVVSGKISERDLDVDIRAKDQKDGRGNICPCTIILPTIAMQAISKLDENATIEQKIVQFLDDLDVKIHQAKDGLIERYNHIISQDKRAATFVWENGTMAGYKGNIESYMKHGTLAIGQLGLAETLQILIGKNQLDSEGMELAKRIESLYNTRCKEFKEKYKLNFGVYYTPKRLWVA